MPAGSPRRRPLQGSISTIAIRRTSGVDRDRSSDELREQGSSVPQNGGVEPFDEPPVGGREEVARAAACLPWARQETGEARRGAQLEGLRLLRTGDGECLLVARAAAFGCYAAREQEVAVEAVELGVDLVLAHRQSRRRRALRISGLAGGLLRLGSNEGAPLWFPAAAAREAIHDLRERRTIAGAGRVESFWTLRRRLMEQMISKYLKIKCPRRDSNARPQD